MAPHDHDGAFDEIDRDDIRLGHSAIASEIRAHVNCRLGRQICRGAWRLRQAEGQGARHFESVFRRTGTVLAYGVREPRLPSKALPDEDRRVRVFEHGRVCRVGGRTATRSGDG